MQSQPMTGANLAKIFILAASLGLVSSSAVAQPALLSSDEAVPVPALSAAKPSMPDVLATVSDRPSYNFSEADNQLLDEVQRGCFNYLWNEVGETGLAKDRVMAPVASVAGVGFQLSALPIGVNRGWVTKQQAEQRALSILRALVPRKDNKRYGIYLHYVDQHTGGLDTKAPQVFAGTVDHALFQAGAMAAGSYFGGEVSQLVDKIVSAAQWKPFLVIPKYVDVPEGLISFGWQPDDVANIAGEGEFRPWVWHANSDEERLVYFLAVGATQPDHAVDPAYYYRLSRRVISYGDRQPYCVSWTGSLFTYFFSHCWIDYGQYTADEPQQFGIDKPRVDWLENSRRATLTHIYRCRELQQQFGTFGQNRWGLSPCMGIKRLGDKWKRDKPSYLVQELMPNYSNVENWHRGTIAPYAAGSAIMFTPDQSVAALRDMRNLKDTNGKPLIWKDPAEGGYGFADSFNLDQPHVSWDNVAIDVGPMIVAIENARTGLVWKLFHQHPSTRAAVNRLGWKPLPGKQ